MECIRAAPDRRGAVGYRHEETMAIDLKQPHIYTEDRSRKQADEGERRDWGDRHPGQLTVLARSCTER